MSNNKSEAIQLYKGSGDILELEEYNKLSTEDQYYRALQFFEELRELMELKKEEREEMAIEHLDYNGDVEDEGSWLEKCYDYILEDEEKDLCYLMTKVI